MTRLAGSFETDLPPPGALAACAEAFEALGWKIHSLEGTHIRSSAAAQDRDGVAIVEVELRGTGEGTALRLVGSDTEDNPLGHKDLAAILDQAQEAIGSRIEAADDDETSETSADGETDDAEVVDAVVVEEDEEPLAPAGWYPDPEQGPGERYWDGEQWTDRFRGADQTAITEERPASRQPDQTRPTSRWWQDRRFWGVAAIALLLGAALGAAAAPSDTKTVTKTKTRTTQGPVRLRTQTETVTRTQTQTAQAQSAPPASAATGGSASKALTTTQCDPNYASPCLDPKASDYDCKGSGDGPNYVAGPVVIVGNDHFGLDESDNDGVGCEK